MANNEIKTNAEIYREQRKERLAKAAKKKSSPKRDKAVRIIVKAVCIILVAAIVLLGAGKALTNIFCLPQKVLNAASYDNKKINVAEYNYYYMSLYNRMYQTASYYDQNYGSGYGSYLTGFDYTADPADQEYVGEDAPEGVKTWADYFKAYSATSAFFYQTIYEKATSEEAEKAGFTYSEEEMNQQINDAITQIETSAKSAQFSVDNYISKVCGEGLTEKTYKELLQRDFIAAEYIEWYQENEGNILSDKEIDKYYKENKDNYDKVTARIFTFEYKGKDSDEESTATYTKAEANELANAMLAKVTTSDKFSALAVEYASKDNKDSFKDDSATLVSGAVKSSVESNAPSVAKWLFDSKRAVGDKTVIEEKDSNMFYVVLLVSLPAPDKTDAGVAVRHILCQAETTDDEGNKLDENKVADNFAEAKKKADAIYKEWKKGDKTEDSFAALAKEKTDDTGSAENGGLYEDINADSSLVPEFLNWSIDGSRKPGDTEIVKTDYGYHIMYFVSKTGEPKYMGDIRNEIGQTNSTEYIEEIYDSIEEGIKENDAVINFFAERTQGFISDNISKSAAVN